MRAAGKFEAITVRVVHDLCARAASAEAEVEKLKIAWHTERRIAEALSGAEESAEEWEARAQAAEASASALRDRVAVLESENARLRKFGQFVLLWCDRGPPHGGPGNEATALNVIRHHPALSLMRTGGSDV